MRKLLNFIKDRLKVRVYSFEETRSLWGGGYGSWNTQYIDDRKDLQLKLLNHIKDRPMVYYLSERCVESAILTKKFGWCFFKCDYDLNFIKFGISKSNTRYDLGYRSDLIPELVDYLDPIITKFEKKYSKDHNL